MPDRFPGNEAETIDLYRLAQARLGWPIKHLQTACPDAVIAKNGHELRAEFEYKAGNFKAHGHRADDCDIIICWRNDWPQSPVPVWALEDCAKEEAKIVRKLLGATVSKSVWLMLMQELQAKTRELQRMKESRECLRRDFILSLGWPILFFVTLIVFVFPIMQTGG